MKWKILILTLTISSGLFVLSNTATSSEQTQTTYQNLFNEVITIVENNFYNPQQITKDFPDIKDSYAQKLKEVSDKNEFSSLLNAMLDELKASHTYYLTPDDPEFYLLGDLFFRIPVINDHFQGQEVKYPSIGIITQTIEKKIFIVSVLPGSIAEKAGLLKGDEIVSVNGKPFSPIVSLQNAADTGAIFLIKRSKDSDPKTLTIKPALVNPKEEMQAAQKSSIRIMEHNGKKIGYIHIYSYAGEEYHQILRDALVWGELKNADALIIDIRYGLGGAWPDYLNIFNRNIPKMTMISRDGEENIVDSQWRKPAVYLVNQFSRSGKELLAFGAKKYNLATVIGERTAGHTLGGRLFPISNGDFLFLAVQSGKVDGVNLEGVGVEPDIKVPFDIRYCNGKDIQIDRAVTYLLNELTQERIKNGQYE